MTETNLVLNWSELDDSELLRTEQVAQWLKISVSKLNKARMKANEGPTFVRVGKSVRYQVIDVKTWITENRRKCIRESYTMNFRLDNWEIEDGEAAEWLNAI